MSIFLILFLSFSSLAFLSACSLVFARQPIYSVLFLILVFCNVSAVGFLLQIEFLPISLIMIYVGAIAVLFLFVLMMLDLKVTELKESNQHTYPLNFFICFILVFELMFFFQESVGIPFNVSPFVSEFTNPWNDFFDFTSWSFVFNNAKVIGFVLFFSYLIPFVVSGFILLVAMVGAICLTLNKRIVTKNQNVFGQITQEYSRCVYSSVGVV
tara:strand:+ start:1990 stop:2625 length:636 start_codon:yes stop_codon:yes gene_type:complete